MLAICSVELGFLFAESRTDSTFLIEAVRREPHLVRMRAGFCASSYSQTGNSAIAYKQNHGKTLLITGAANGLGRALLQIYAEKGWKLAFTDVDEENGREIVKQLTQRGVRVEFFPFDVTQASDWSELLARLQANWSQLDLLINCAARLTVGEVGDQELSASREVIETTLLGTIYACETFVPWLKQNSPGGHIVNVASCAGFLGMPWSASYNASKAGIMAYSETLYTELQPCQIGVTIACPGFFASRLLNRAPYTKSELQRAVSHIVGKSAITAETVAASIVEAVESKQLYLMTPFAVRKLWWFKRLAPRRLLNSVQAKAQRLRQRFLQD